MTSAEFPPRPPRDVINGDVTRDVINGDVIIVSAGVVNRSLVCIAYRLDVCLSVCLSVSEMEPGQDF